MNPSAKAMFHQFFDTWPYMFNQFISTVLPNSTRVNFYESLVKIECHQLYSLFNECIHQHGCTRFFPVMLSTHLRKLKLTQSVIKLRNLSQVTEKLLKSIHLGFTSCFPCTVKLTIDIKSVCILSPDTRTSHSRFLLNVFIYLFTNFL